MAALVADWVATLFRPYPSTADLDRLTESVLSALTATVSAAEARLEAVTALVDRAVRDFHEHAHEGAFAECRRAPCGPIRDGLARAT